MTSANLCIPLTAGVTCAAAILTLLIAFVSFTLGFICGTDKMKKRLSPMVEARGHLDAPVYEEIEHTGKLQVGNKLCKMLRMGKSRRHMTIHLQHQ